jgi:hypothetical protein
VGKRTLRRLGLAAIVMAVVMSLAPAAFAGGQPQPAGHPHAESSR